MAINVKANNKRRIAIDKMVEEATPKEYKMFCPPFCIDCGTELKMNFYNPRCVECHDELWYEKARIYDLNNGGR